jgi:hypothetical protein
MRCSSSASVFGYSDTLTCCLTSPLLAHRLARLFGQSDLVLRGGAAEVLRMWIML